MCDHCSPWLRPSFLSNPVENSCPFSCPTSLALVKEQPAFPVAVARLPLSLLLLYSICVQAGINSGSFILNSDILKVLTRFLLNECGGQVQKRIIMRYEIIFLMLRHLSSRSKDSRPPLFFSAFYLQKILDFGYSELSVFIKWMNEQVSELKNGMWTVLGEKENITPLAIFALMES